MPLPSALSLDKTSVDAGSLFCSGRRGACIILDFLQPTRLPPQQPTKIDGSCSGCFLNSDIRLDYDYEHEHEHEHEHEFLIRCFVISTRLSSGAVVPPSLLLAPCSLLAASCYNPLIMSQPFRAVIFDL